MKNVRSDPCRYLSVLVISPSLVCSSSMFINTWPICIRNNERMYILQLMGNLHCRFCILGDLFHGRFSCVSAEVTTSLLMQSDALAHMILYCELARTLLPANAVWIYYDIL